VLSLYHGTVQNHRIGSYQHACYAPVSCLHLSGCGSDCSTSWRRERSEDNWLSHSLSADQASNPETAPERLAKTRLLAPMLIGSGRPGEFMRSFIALNARCSKRHWMFEHKHNCLFIEEAYFACMDGCR